ncbi:hypothetical protein NDU88_004372 [Pleurodeles waltl]|uniref:Uncharacterized protein n=1 Tax=Pleurodeles waltl TaxID=8319 RepID=A0AAV7SIQ1_PLEWA|nr:hypothetical protein NDU88_004372 [Pleurodeles waltl]
MDCPQQHSFWACGGLGDDLAVVDLKVTRAYRQDGRWAEEILRGPQGGSSLTNSGLRGISGAAEIPSGRPRRDVRVLPSPVDLNLPAPGVVPRCWGPQAIGTFWCDG